MLTTTFSGFKLATSIHLVPKLDISQGLHYHNKNLCFSNQEFNEVSLLKIRNKNKSWLFFKVGMDGQHL